MSTLIWIIQSAAWLLTVLVIASVFLSYFMSPYHPVRSTIDRIVNPILNPIRRIVPPLQGIDFSPVVLVILIQILETVIVNLLA